MGVSERLIRFLHDRPAHDGRYALNSEKIAVELG
jgi:dTDP-D-glucose 4,6-dehydratase